MRTMPCSPTPPSCSPPHETVRRRGCRIGSPKRLSVTCAVPVWAASGFTTCGTSWPPRCSPMASPSSPSRSALATPAPRPRSTCTDTASRRRPRCRPLHLKPHQRSVNRHRGRRSPLAVASMGQRNFRDPVIEPSGAVTRARVPDLAPERRRHPESALRRRAVLAVAADYRRRTTRHAPWAGAAFLATERRRTPFGARLRRLLAATPQPAELETTPTPTAEYGRDRFGAWRSFGERRAQFQADVGYRVPSSTSLSRRRMILPDAVTGTSSTNWTARGTLYAARCSRQCATSASAVTSQPGFRTT